MAVKHRTLRLIVVIVGVAVLFLYNCNQCSFSATLLMSFPAWKVQFAFPVRRTQVSPIINSAIEINDRGVAETEKKTNVLIIAQGRSGSSFLGQLFNQHSDVLFLYEPLYNLEQVEQKDSIRGNSPQEYNRLATTYLQDILTCSFRNEKYLAFMSRLGHFRFSSRVLKSPPFCHPKAQKENLSDIISQGLCDSLTKDELERTCRKHKLSVIKLLSHRIPHQRISYLLTNLSSESYNLIVIHLVRDPRAVINSMWKNGWISHADATDGSLYPYSPSDQQFHWFVQKICNDTITNVNFGIDFVPRNRVKYKLVKYEDFVQKPQQIAKIVYNFTGLKMSSKIEKWIYEATHPKSSEDTDDPYSTRKDPRFVVSSWKTELDNYTRKVVEKYCSPILNMLGY